MVNYQILQRNPYNEQTILLTDTQLVKIAPDYSDTKYGRTILTDIQKEDRIRDILQKCITDTHPYFVFWETPNPSILKKDDLAQLFPGLRLNQNQYTIRMVNPTGWDLEILFQFENTCPMCIPRTLPKEITVPTKPLRMTARYALNFLLHLITDLYLLASCRITHQDLRLANILLNPTVSEIETGILDWPTSTLPRLIDFGSAKIYPPETNIEEVLTRNYNDLIVLLTTCIHGKILLISSYYPEACPTDELWIRKVLVPGQADVIEPILKIFETSPISVSSLTSLYDVIQSFFQKL